MSDTLDWLCGQIGARRDEVLSQRQYRDLVNKRRIVIAFFHFLKKSTPWIGAVINKDHSTVVTVLKNLPTEYYNMALKLYEKYEVEINGRNIEELKVEAIKKTVWKKVPDYKHSCTIMKEVEIGEKQKYGLPPVQNNKGWNK